MPKAKGKGNTKTRTVVKREECPYCKESHVVKQLMRHMSRKHVSIWHELTQWLRAQEPKLRMKESKKEWCVYCYAWCPTKNRV